ncbi:beta-galactosidase [Lutibacter oricola]|uniref:Beta-galactosidase n=1 Tax=Lutibacter oricola TaxID=762486 RepID=A0A1H3FUC8_9FLAO|nr:glycoside hydrolase family 2 TIM barrel-domain containing protein [Lutibacter oricola]SDX93968.1 beta-galactosidase [Lutibacter oricola]
MKNTLLILLSIILLSCSKTPTKNTKENFDFDWKFYAGDIENVEKSNFDDSKWRTVNLPHDWSIEGNFSKNNPSFSRGGWLPTGKVAYRKTFTVPSTDKNKRIVIYFDGAYRNSEVYINGKLLGKRPFGYIAFYYDMTEHINFGKENVITVKLDNSKQPGSRWYTGTGIYRHVHLITTNKLYIPVWGNYIVANKIKNSKAEINVETTVKNDFDTNENIDISVSIFNEAGKLITSKKESKAISKNESIKHKSILTVENPTLWDINNPYQYSIRTEIIQNNKIVYTETTKTGIRTLTFNHTEGFKLNGKTVKLKGVCLHHDGGPLGAAVHKRTIERQLEKLREMGCNSVRTAHNPFSEEFLNICDEMGFLVMNEAFDEWERPKQPATTQNGKKQKITVHKYAHLFKKWAAKDLEDFILRDRNHPSVIMWSIGNEIDQMRDETGIAIGKRLVDIVHKFDYRPATNGVHGYWDMKRPNQEAAATSDIYGYNYIKQDRMDWEREQFPNVMAVITEHESAQSFYPRSTYLYGKQKEQWWNKLNYKYDDAYKWVEKRDIRGEAGMEAWRLVKESPFLMGMFIWTGWDYIGETIPFGWPARSSSFAPIDLAGFPKDGYYFYQSQWSNKPMVHIFPHWNLEGMEGKKVSVYSYTNGDEVELFQDGKSLGKQKNNTEKVEYQTWNVVYKPGELKAISYKNGKIIAEKMVKTAGKPSKIKIETRRTKMNANGQDLIYVECTILDKNGNEVPTANNLLKFNVEGAAIISGVANGDNMGLEPFKAKQRTAFNGKCLAIIQSTQKAGNIKLSITSKGLESTTINFKSN